VADGTRTRDLPSHNPTTSVATGCLKLQNRLIQAGSFAGGCAAFLRVALWVVSAVVSNRVGLLRVQYHRPGKFLARRMTAKRRRRCVKAPVYGALCLLDRTYAAGSGIRYEERWLSSAASPPASADGDRKPTYPSGGIRTRPPVGTPARAGSTSGS
jgi:hypothetical protein